jgi:Na+/H+ antiporter NhaD/arsenite permease-like protein
VHVLSAIFALLVAIAGWHYLFYSRAAHRLGEFENERLNQRRILLRRMAGLCMLALGACFFIGFWGFDLDNLRGRADTFVLVWLAVALLILILVVLALIDLTWTARLRRRARLERDKIQ